MALLGRPGGLRNGAKRFDVDHGIGLVEVILAIFLLVIMALGVLPLLVGSSKTTLVNRNLVAATSYASSRLAAIRDSYPDVAESTCAQVTSQNASGVVDPAGTGLLADVVVGACPSAYPDAMTVKVRVRDAASNTLAELSTRIVVTQA